jgi:DNA polymerase-4
MDAFFASVEQLDHPELKHKPIAVGGSSDRGVVAAASYEARQYGVKSAMSSVVAKRKCPNLIFVKPHFERYKEVSSQIKAIFYEYTDLVEPLSLDEAFLDVTINKKGLTLASEIAKDIREKIFLTTGLTCSAGISINKFVAKLATEINKPNGQKTIHPVDVELFLEKLPIYKFFGIGKVTAQKMNSWGIYTGKDLKNQSVEFLNATFGKQGHYYYNIVRGIHDAPVISNRLRKSIGIENTYQHNLLNMEDISKAFKVLCKKLVIRLHKQNKKGKTISIKIKYNDFSLLSRQKTIDHYTASLNTIQATVNEIVLDLNLKKPIRLLGVSISNFEKYKDNYKPKQLTLNF